MRVPCLPNFVILKPDKDQIPVKSFRQVPYNIYRIYEESIQSFNIGNYILCAAGLRAVIEGICEEEICEE